MMKREEIANEDSCLSRAKSDEYLFVLMGRDVAAPETIRFWVKERVRLGRNKPTDRQIIQALLTAQSMEEEQKSGFAPLPRD